MLILSILLSFISGVIAALHLSWAFGSTWPRQDELTLARSVVGRKGITGMPPRWASALVASCLGVVAAWALMLGQAISVPAPPWLLIKGGLAIAAVFITRGMLGYLPAFRRIMSEQPFARLNAQVYSPLCLMLGAGYAGLVLLVLIGRV